MTTEGNTGGRARAEDRSEDQGETREEPRDDFMIVGLGASAGGLQALTAFFEQLPPDTGLAFVVVTHQHPGHVSLMPEILGKHTKLPVVEADEGMLVEPNHVYLSPPGAMLALMGGALHNMRADVDRHTNHPVLPIDYFFRSLAEEVHDRAIAIVLSGTGSDGSVGAKIIKRESGLVMAENPRAATYDGMPRSVIATGLVDYIETAPELARKVVSYARRKIDGQTRLPPPPDQSPHEIHRALVLVRDHTGHDFSSYKENTIRRRMERRMNLHQLDTTRDYVSYLHQNPAEVDILFRELLIGVTNFFRDPDAFEALAARLPQLLEGKRDRESVRVWVPGCSTGEEAYSIAMLLRETMLEDHKRATVQIFATDLDPVAIDMARAGVYPEGIAVDVGEARLERFFSRRDAAYHVSKEIRDMVVFAPQNVITDPPFTKLDLLSCRNLLIYLNSQLQRRLLPLFHYALKPGGLLFLGTSESIGTFTELFAPVDKKWKLFERLPTSSQTHPRFPLDALTSGDNGQRGPGVPAPRRPPQPIGKLIEKLLVAEHIPPSVVVNDRGTIVHIHGRTGLFLEPASGQPSLNVLDMARDGLQPTLAACLRRASAGAAELTYEGVRVRTNGDHIFVDVSARRLTEPETLRGLILLTLRQRVPAPLVSTEEVSQAPLSAGEMNQLEAVEHELRYTKETLQSTIEELETSNEELKSTNEELQSTNEELQSTNEELETSKEEMQSLNEELHTVNSELEEKVADLSQANDDMTNLLNSTEIATVFLDDELRINRFTQSATRIIKLIHSDVGRPIDDLASKLEYESLVADANEVLRTLVPRERELLSKDGKWFLMRMVPYRTTDNIIDGLVMTLVDISDQKQAFAQLQHMQETVRRREQALSVVLSACPIHIFAARVDRDLRYTWVCDPPPDFDAESMIGKRDDELLDPEASRALVELKRRVIDSGEGEQRDISLELSDGHHTWRVCAEPLRDADDRIVGVTSVALDLGELTSSGQ